MSEHKEVFLMSDFFNNVLIPVLLGSYYPGQETYEDEDFDFDILEGELSPEGLEVMEKMDDMGFQASLTELQLDANRLVSMYAGAIEDRRREKFATLTAREYTEWVREDMRGPFCQIVELIARQPRESVRLEGDTYMGQHLN